jgi:hypothetical protein
MSNELKMDIPFDKYKRDLPSGKFCKDCTNYNSCVVYIGEFKVKDNNLCHFYPNKFKDKQ